MIPVLFNVILYITVLQENDKIILQHSRNGMIFLHKVFHFFFFLILLNSSKFNV